MACAVYCLVPRPEQIEPLLDRLRDAGVNTRDISVVLRDRPAAAPVIPWWPLLWPLAFYPWPELPPSEGDRVVPLAQYRRAGLGESVIGE